MNITEKLLKELSPNVDSIINHHFLLKLESGTYSINEIRIFSEQYYLISCAFTRFLLIAGANIKNEEHRMPIIDNLYDEHGRGNYLHSHRVLLQKFMTIVETKKVDQIVPLPSTSAYINGMFKLCESNSELEILGAIGPGCEYFTDLQYSRIVKPLFEIYKYTKDDLFFFYEHINHDPRHTSDIDNIILDLVKNDSDFNLVINGAKQSIIFEKIFWDGLYEACEKSMTE